MSNVKGGMYFVMGIVAHADEQLIKSSTPLICLTQKTHLTEHTV